MSKDVVENYINNQKYNALQKKKRPAAHSRLQLSKTY